MTDEQDERDGHKAGDDATQVTSAEPEESSAADVPTDSAAGSAAAAALTPDGTVKSDGSDGSDGSVGSVGSDGSDGSDGSGGSDGSDDSDGSGAGGSDEGVATSGGSAGADEKAKPGKADADGKAKSGKTDVNKSKPGKAGADGKAKSGKTDADKSKPDKSKPGGKGKPKKAGSGLGATSDSEPVEANPYGADPYGLPVAPPTSSRVALVVVSIAAVLLFAAAALFGVLWLRARNDSATAASARTAAVTSAQKIAIDFSTYDYRHLDQNFNDVASQLTGKFATDYRATAASLKATLTQYQGVATAKVLEAGLVRISSTRAVVIVFIDQTVTSKVSSTPTIDRNRVRVTMQRDGDRWLATALDLP